NDRKHPLADYESFKLLDNGYAKDKFQVYFTDSIVDGADPATFISHEYADARDKNYCYSGRRRLDIKDCGSYTLLQGWYSKDKFFVYYKGDIVVNADPGSIDFITGSVWVRDNKSYFYEGKQVNFVDYNSFQYLDYNYAKDKNNVYYNNEIIE